MQKVFKYGGMNLESAWGNWRFLKRNSDSFLSLHFKSIESVQKLLLAVHSESVSEFIIWCGFITRISFFIFTPSLCHFGSSFSPSKLSSLRRFHSPLSQRNLFGSTLFLVEGPPTQQMICCRVQSTTIRSLTTTSTVLQRPQLTSLSYYCRESSSHVVVEVVHMQRIVLQG